MNALKMHVIMMVNGYGTIALAKGILQASFVVEYLVDKSFVKEGL